MNKTAHFANLVIKFGKRNMLDRSEVVLSAFLKDTRVRVRGRTEYHFLNVKLEELEENDLESLTVFGRFVKDTQLEREQIYKSGLLTESVAYLQSSPSAFFALNLATHRLIYLAETKHAPSLDELRTTIEYFVRLEYKAHLRKLYDEANASGGRVTWNEIYEENPSPTVHLVPLTSRGSIDAFVNNFSKIKRLKVQLIERNDEMKGGELIAGVQEHISKLNPNNAQIQARNAGEGLDAENTKEFMEEATSAGYEDVELSGESETGATLSGSNESFKLKQDVEVEGRSLRGTAQELLSVFRSLVDEGLIRLGFGEQEEAAIRQKLKQIVDRM